MVVGYDNSCTDERGMKGGRGYELEILINNLVTSNSSSHQ